ncbi:hydroxymethylglutaryl-CoA lyase [Thalassospira sp. GB04J01]|uniref:hydroxymethylglutaryl-CoA lyase n=1 Tax=Thalassospira sp. GB04J01 TaxID=1485225 RepID=UPI000C9B1B1F|nr:hydroxymethylglutaryl-CoA lyase [Thalassospira sp. GB04J01]|tara:strand:- start:4997 stop:5875 length:879 start_codon:yes stop_codon:yes gene_type:complete
MSDVLIYEVGPRDGLQNEKSIIPTDAKIALIDALSGAGFTKIEATSFVSPKWVPQLADAAEVMAGITRDPAVTYAALTPNIKGFERAVAAGVTEVAVFAAASEGFSQKNINCSIAESIERFKPLLQSATASNIVVRGYVSCVVECPYEGAVQPESVKDVTQQLIDLGCYEVSLGDTIGAGTPSSIQKMLEEVLKSIPASKLAGHFHDTDNQAIDNVFASLEMGIRTFDSAVGGLGGCPYAPGAKGNVATGELVDALEKRGWQTGIDLRQLSVAEQQIRALVTGHMNDQEAAQ